MRYLLLRKMNYIRQIHLVHITYQAIWIVAKHVNAPGPTGAGALTCIHIGGILELSPLFQALHDKGVCIVYY